MNRADLVPVWLQQGADVVIVREKPTGRQRLPGVVHTVRPDLAWGQVRVTADNGGLYSFDLTEHGVIGAVNGLDAHGFPTHLMAPEDIEAP